MGDRVSGLPQAQLMAAARKGRWASVALRWASVALRGSCGAVGRANRHASLPGSDANRRKKSCPTLQSLAATNLRMSINSQGADGSRLIGGVFMADDMEKKGQQGGQPGQGQQGGKPGQYDQPGQPGQGQQSGQPGQQQPKKGGQGQHDEEDDQNRDRQRRA